MGSPTTTNTLATIVNNAVKAALTGGKTAVEAAVIADVPWLGLPVIRQILEWALNQVGDVFYTQAADALTKIIIDLQVGAETSAVNSAFQNTQSALMGGDPNAITKASQDLDAAFADLVHSDGSASP